MENERQISMLNCSVRIIVDGETIKQELSCKFGNLQDIEVEVFNNQKEWTLNKIYDIHIRLVDFDSYIGELTLKSINVVDYITTLYFA